MPAVGGFVLGALGIGGGVAFSAAGGAMFAGWVAGAAFGSTVIGGLAVKLLTTVALSALSTAINSQPDIAQAGLEDHHYLDWWHKSRGLHYWHDRHVGVTALCSLNPWRSRAKNP